MSGSTFTTYSVLAAQDLSGSIGANISPDVDATTTATALAKLGITTVRTTVTTDAEAATLGSLAALGVKFDLVLAPSQTVSSFIGYAEQLDNTDLSGGTTASNSVVLLEGPNLVDNPGYTFVANDQYYGPNGTTSTNPNQSGGAAGDAATVEIYQAAAADTVAAALRSTTVLPYSIGTTGNPDVGGYGDALNINPGNTALAEPDRTALSNADAIARANLPKQPPLNYVTEAGSANPGTLLDVLLNARYAFNSTTTFIDSLSGTVSAAVAAATGSPVTLVDGSGNPTAAGTALLNLQSILNSGLGSTAPGSLALSVPAYSAGTQAAAAVEVFAGPNGGENIVWWDANDAYSASGHGAAKMDFSSVQGTVSVYDPTQSASPIASYTNVSELDVSNFGNGPLVVQVSGTASAAGTVATYAGTASTGTTTVSPTVTGGTNTGGIITAAAGGTTVTQPSTTTTVNVSDSGTDTIISRGTDTINAGTGTDVVFASGPAATVNGAASGKLVFVAGSGNYVVNGNGEGTTIYGGSGTSTYTAGSTGGGVLVAGTGNTTLNGGNGNGVVMFGNSGATTFIGSGGGNDIMVGGSGANTFTLTKGDAAFGGTSTDVFNTTASSVIVGGSGNDTVNFGAGSSIAFAGPGKDVFTLTAGTSGPSSIVGFTSSDHLILSGLASGQSGATVLAAATKGSFGTQLNLGSGTTVTLFGVTNLTSSQIN